MRFQIQCVLLNVAQRPTMPLVMQCSVSRLNNTLYNTQYMLIISTVHVGLFAYRCWVISISECYFVPLYQWYNTL